jgi:cysteine desulfurase
MRQIYLDYNATTPIAPSVFEAMVPFLTEHFGNPSSSHARGVAAHQAVEDARERVATLIGAQPDELVFTSGGTESNNLALQGITQSDGRRNGHIIISAVEHPAIREPARQLARSGCACTIVPTDRFGQVIPDQIAQAIRDNTVLVSIMHANNEIGSVQPIRDIADVCRSRGIRLHTDAAQSIGKIRAKVDELDVDLLTVAGHKFYAPKGVGALYVRRGVALQPVTFGAGHERGLRPGTENVASIVGIGQAARLAERGLDENQTRLSQLRDRLFDDLREGIGPELTFNGPSHDRLPNTLSVNFPRVIAQQLLDRAPDICASTGAACHSGSTQLSATLAAIKLSPEIARGTVRLSLGWHTSLEDVQHAASALLAAWESLVE